MTDPEIEFWADTPVLVTGAAGFLGPWVIRNFSSMRANVIGLDISLTDEAQSLAQSGAVEIVGGDVREEKTLSDILGDLKIEVVIHLAAQTLVGPALENPAHTFDHNIRGTWTLLEACRHASSVKAIVAASSDKAYGDFEGVPYDEETPLRPTHPYDSSKACGELIARTYAKSYRQPAVITRCGNLYGGGDLNWSRIVPGTVRSVLNSERPVIRSDGSYIRDYLYVEDAAKAIVALARGVAERSELHGEAFNFAADARLTVLEMTQKILDLMESDLTPEILDTAVGEIQEQRLRSDKARELLGWRPAYSVDEGLARTISWYSSFLAK